MNTTIIFSRNVLIQGSAAIKFLISLAVLGLLIFSAWQAYPIFIMNQEHQTFQQAIATQVQAITVLSIPDTQTKLTDDITQQLTVMRAQYEPQYIQVNIEKAQQRLSVQVWYQRPHHSLFVSNPRLFYLSAEKTGFERIIDATATAKTTDGAAGQTAFVFPHSAPKPKTSHEETPQVKVHPVTLTDANFAKEVLESPTPVLVDFWAAWCGPCRQAAPAVEAAATKFAGQVKVGKLDIDQNPKMSDKYGVRGIPTFILFKNGKRAGTQEGFGGQQHLFEFIREHGS